MLLKSVSALLALASFVVADSEISCSASKKCPEDKPCCSQYGVCGVGAYCLSACDPRFSFNVSSCVPLPICNSKDIQFSSTSNIVEQSKYLGDASKYDFVTSNTVLEYDNNVLLTMANGSYGTVLTSTRAVWYGKVSATMKTSRTQGVVSAFILMSPVKDEIDYESIGSYLESVQTNFYWQGYLNYTNSQNVSLSNTFENYHTYTIDWTEDTITWLIDGQPGRVLKKADTYNATTGIYEFPQTPSVIQISLWPGGSSANGKGTVDWAGGAINWDAEDIKSPGYFYVTLKDVSIQCYDLPSNVTKSGSKAYKFTSNDGLGNHIEITDDSYVLGSFEAVGFDMNKGSDADLSNVSGSVPSGVAAGSNGNRGDGDSSNNNSNIANASVVSISSTSQTYADASGTSSKPKPTSTKSESLADASGSASKTSAASTATKSSSSSSSQDSKSTSASENKSAETSAAATSQNNGGFNQGGSTSETTSASKSNAAGNLNVAAGSVLGMVMFLAVLLSM